MFLKSFLPAISILLGIFGIVMINKFPMKKYSLEENYRRITIYSSIGYAYDVIMFLFLGFFLMPPGEYGTWIEIIITMVVMLFYAPACLITSFRLKKRMKQLNDSKHNVSQMNVLNISVFFKALFFLVGIIWVVEV